MPAAFHESGQHAAEGCLYAIPALAGVIFRAALAILLEAALATHGPCHYHQVAHAFDWSAGRLDAACCALVG